jgi:hypothetical protein
MHVQQNIPLTVTGPVYHLEQSVDEFDVLRDQSASQPSMQVVVWGQNRTSRVPSG